MAQRERIVEAIIQVNLFKKNLPVLNFPVTEEGEFGCERAKISDSMNECDAQDIYLLLSLAHIVLWHRKGPTLERTGRAVPGAHHRKTSKAAIFNQCAVAHLCAAIIC